MAFASGMAEALYVGFEQSFKVLPATWNVFKVPVINPRMTPAVGRFTSEALTGLPQPRPPAFGKQGLDWTVDLECNKDSLAPFLKGHFATPTDQGASISGYDHYYGFGTMVSMAMEERHTDVTKNFLYQGKYCGSMDATLDAEGLLKITFGGIGASMVNKNSGTGINGTITDYTVSLPLNMVAGVVKIGGTAVLYFQQISIRSNRGLDKRNHIDGTPAVGVIFSQIPTVEVSIRASFQDTTLLDQAIANSETTLIEFYVLEAGTGHGLKYTMPTVTFRPTAPETQGTGLVNLNFTGDAYARGSASDIAGETLGGFLGTGVLTGLNTKTLIVKPDALTNETFTFTITEENGGLDAVVTKINATAVGLTADNEGGRLRLTSKTKGTSSKINVQAGGTGNTILKLNTGVDCSGFAAQSIMARLSNANATG